MNLTLGFSPCPNDTFIFDALVNKLIDTEGFEFEAEMHDVQTLNSMAIDGKLSITKISYGVLPQVTQHYKVLNSGGALGKGAGPLLIAKTIIPDLHSQLSNLTIAIPGQNTTANMLFSMAFPAADKKHFMIFNQVEDAVLSGVTDAGVIIHENRFTYLHKGLVKLMDLGEFWEAETHLPIPLGGIVIKRTIDENLQRTVDRLIQASLAYSFANYPVLSPFVKQHSQEMSEDVMRQHINLYVNDYSINLGATGKRAVNKVLEIFNLTNADNVFVSD